MCAFCRKFICSASFTMAKWKVGESKFCLAMHTLDKPKNIFRQTFPKHNEMRWFFFVSYHTKIELFFSEFCLTKTKYNFFSQYYEFSFIVPWSRQHFTKACQMQNTTLDHKYNRKYTHTQREYCVRI